MRNSHYGFDRDRGDVSRGVDGWSAGCGSFEDFRQSQCILAIL